MAVANDDDMKLIGHLRSHLRGALLDFFPQSGISGALRQPGVAPTAEGIALHLGANREATQRFLNAFVFIGTVRVDEARKTYSLVSPAPTISTAEAQELFRMYDQAGGNPGNVQASWSQSEIGASLLRSDRAKVFKYIHYIRDVLGPFFTPKVLSEALRTGESQWLLAKGLDVKQIFELYEREPQLLAFFQAVMADANREANRKLVDNLTFSGGEQVLDVGGGTGELGKQILNSAGSVGVYEYEGGREVLEPLIVDPRLQYFWGDFMKSNATGGLYGLPEDKKYDTLVLGWILHDWDDQVCLGILQRLRQHLKPGGRIVVFETVLDPLSTGPEAVSDVLMMVFANARERTQSQFQQLFKQAGYNTTQHIVAEARRQVFVLGADCGDGLLAAGK